MSGGGGYQEGVFDARDFGRIDITDELNAFPSALLLARQVVQKQWKDCGDTITRKEADETVIQR